MSKYLTKTKVKTENIKIWTIYKSLLGTIWKLSHIYIKGQIY